ncbi:MAG: hypothetical protein AB7S99_09105, partial [Pseudodonghicola sp.]
LRKADIRASRSNRHSPGAVVGRSAQNPSLKQRELSPALNLPLYTEDELNNFNTHGMCGK